MFTLQVKVNTCDHNDNKQEYALPEMTNGLQANKHAAFIGFSDLPLADDVYFPKVTMEMSSKAGDITVATVVLHFFLYFLLILSVIHFSHER